MIIIVDNVIAGYVNFYLFGCVIYHWVPSGNSFASTVVGLSSLTTPVPSKDLYRHHVYSIHINYLSHYILPKVKC